MKLSLAIALVKLITALMGFFQQQRWYQAGLDAARAEQAARDKEVEGMIEDGRTDLDKASDDDIEKRLRRWQNS